MLLDVAKAVIKANFVDGGIFNTRNVVGDPTQTLFIGNLFDYYGNIKHLQIDVLWGDYFEVFGLSDEEFAELKKFYEDIRSINRKEYIASELISNLDTIERLIDECASNPKDLVRITKHIEYLCGEAHEMIKELKD